MLSRRQTLQALAGTAALSMLPSSMAANARSKNQTFHPFDFDKRAVKLNNGIDMPIIGIGV